MLHSVEERTARPLARQPRPFPQHLLIYWSKIGKMKGIFLFLKDYPDVFAEATLQWRPDLRLRRSN